MKTMLKRNERQLAISLFIFLTVIFVSCQKELVNSSKQNSTTNQQNALSDWIFCSVVPGTSNPWLAGMPDGTSAGFGDFAPAESPVLVSIKQSDAWIEVSHTSGKVSNCQCNLVGPDGDNFNLSHDVQFGKSSFIAPANSLVGVFLNDNVPMGTPPTPLDFSTQKSRDYKKLYPQLKQVFFIGDGKTSENNRQKIFIPEGATRLFLGTTDGVEWNNNIGAFHLIIVKRFSE
jgi:hypothetical protein